MAHAGGFSARIATRSPGWMPRPFKPSESARTVNPKSEAEIGFHCPSTLEISRFGFPLAAAARKRSQRVRGALGIESPSSPDCVLRLGAGQGRRPRPCRRRGLTTPGASDSRTRNRISFVAIALLAGTLLALAGFLLTSVQGFALASHLAAAAPAARVPGN